MRRYFTWNEFDKSVEHIANKCNSLKFSGIYGVPRGGLCLAVALSHQLKIKLLEEPKNNALIVDDVYETGFTLKNYRKIEGATFFVLFSKIKPLWWESVNFCREEEWITFPWENKNHAMNEKKEFLKKRRSN